MGLFTLKEKCIMLYLSGEDPVVITTKDRDFKIGDIIISDDRIIYEIIYLGEECKLSNIARHQDFLNVNYEYLSECCASPHNSLDLSFKYEKVTRIINTKW